jgi:hypothetical protein
MVFRITGSAALLFILTSSVAGAGVLTTGSVAVAPGDQLRCDVVNVGGSTADEIEMRVVFNNINGNFSSTAATSCTNVAPDRSCRLSATAITGNDSMFCRVTSKGGKPRGTFCNVTKGLCTDVTK